MRPERNYIVKEMKDNLKDNPFFFVADYKGLSVADVTNLRDQLRDGESHYQIFKNRLFKRIVEENNYPKELEQDLKGFSAFVIGGKDVAHIAKVLVDFSKKHKTFSVKAGVIENNYFSAAKVKTLASLPPKNVLIAQTVSAIAAPLTGFVGVLNERIRSFVGVLAAIADKKKESN